MRPGPTPASLCKPEEVMRRSRILAAAAAVAVSLGIAQSANAADYESGQVIVKPKAGVALTRVLGLSGVGSALQQVDGVGATVVSVKGSVPAAARAIQASGLVTYAEPNYTLKVTATPNDALFGQLLRHAEDQRPRAGTPPGSARSRRPAASRSASSTPASTRPMRTWPARPSPAPSRAASCILSGSIQDGSCADDNGHGSHVAGTITANANNGVGVAGVAFNSPLVDLQGARRAARLRARRPTSPTASPGCTTRARRSSR